MLVSELDKYIEILKGAIMDVDGKYPAPLNAIEKIGEVKA